MEDVTDLKFVGLYRVGSSPITCIPIKRKERIMAKNNWLSSDLTQIKKGDIICNKKDQDFLRLVIYVDEVAIWCIGLVHCAFAESEKEKPIFPMYFDEIEDSIWVPILRLGNLENYAQYIADIEPTIKEAINNIDGRLRMI